jgi:hypothetical protein
LNSPYYEAINVICGDRPTSLAFVRSHLSLHPILSYTVSFVKAVNISLFFQQPRLIIRKTNAVAAILMKSASNIQVYTYGAASAL